MKYKITGYIFKKDNFGREVEQTHFIPRIFDTKEEAQVAYYESYTKLRDYKNLYNLLGESCKFDFKLKIENVL